ncbi:MULTISPECIES: NAD(P)/FAD-dependent oxidoreductase [Rhizobium]|uniref:FAD-binding oxidoreductase n=1 Tax=Rhizobium tropici TaxID=398 RepID=A0A6P1CBJ0_RHITR|nr:MULTISPECIES: FAD-binding oxidoreductase [Rhizobium]AGB75532.1 fructosyl-amino acid oxidase [Rhizobium tropici CIAT 899]MBB4241906.1 glycine/D-amino acid oxidase-like deaminating enzyme [Rhizobium tropici]MBB5593448.1 glycine/D-amino acid oxidase-like deaminating enzyme [Rhizobium tropici]MBB6492231.1 glycine/D-amino acid oxidase-like deaminating enzyme [Rhizobium tropici]NEV13492.1 FAD-binding oxidoreductase [Rhizobium tropici]
MHASTRPSKVVVVGGGIFGVSTAVHLARLGVQTTLINDGPLANGASGRSLAWLNSARRRSDAYHRLRLAGIDRYRTLSAKYPDAAWLRFDGGLTWDADDAGNDIAAVFEYERDLAYHALLLTPDQIAKATPGVDADSVTRQGAIFNPGEGWVDLPSLIGVLAEEFRSLGGEIVTDAGRARVNVRNGRAIGVTTANGADWAADAVLLAAGGEVPAIIAEAGQHIGDDTPIALLVRTKPIRHPLKAVLNTPRVAIRPTPDGAFALDSAWSEEEVIVKADDSYEIKPSTLEGLLQEASRVLQGNPKLEIGDYGVGPKPIPGDGEPVFGELQAIPGYFVAFSHSGATLGLIAGELLADEIATGKRHPLLASFRPERFAR